MVLIFVLGDLVGTLKVKPTKVTKFDPGKKTCPGNVLKPFKKETNYTINGLRSLL